MLFRAFCFFFAGEQGKRSYIYIYIHMLALKASVKNLLLAGLNFYTPPDFRDRSETLKNAHML